MKCHGIGENGKPVSDTFVSSTGTKSYVCHECVWDVLWLMFLLQ